MAGLVVGSKVRLTWDDYKGKVRHFFSDDGNEATICGYDVWNAEYQATFKNMWGEQVIVNITN